MSLKIIGVFLGLLALGCSRQQPELPQKPHPETERLSIVRSTTIIKTDDNVDTEVYIIRDKETGKEYLYTISIRGTSIFKLE
jgi:hypothetical protein